MVRCFSPERLELCAKWFDLVETPDDWQELGPVGEGESQSIRVQSGGMLGIAKPGPAVAANDTCRAAHEKLAFDLAHILELPVPPVVLWGNGLQQPFARGRSISAWAFPQSLKWDAAHQKGLLSTTSQASASIAVSAMRVFHTWISDTDRKSDHIQVDADSEDGKLATAFIDHAYSMSHVWKHPDHPAGQSPRYLPDLEKPAVILETIDRIATMPNEVVSRIVNRVPSGYLPVPQRDHILANLLSRKGNLRTILGV